MNQPLRPVTSSNRFSESPCPGAVEPNGSERLLRPAVFQWKMTSGYRAMWAAEGEAAIRTIVDTARLTGGTPFATILKTVSA